MPRTSAAAACRGVVKTYVTPSEKVEALRGVDATFPAGAVSAVVGASGSGKSTLLRLLAGLDLPSSGSVVVDGRDLGVLPMRAVRDVRRTHVAYVFQRPSDNLVSYLTLAEHVHLLAATPEGGLELLADVGLGHRGGHLPRELSSGEQQRAAFALAASRGVGLIVADEPTAELDTESATAVLEVVRRLAAGGRSLVLATHDRDVRAVADHVVELEHGTAREDVGYAARPRPVEPRPPVRESLRAEIVVSVRDVTRSYGPVEALPPLTFGLRRGELAALLGRSGSGKTTLLNILAGWETPDAGEVERPCVPVARPWQELSIAPQRLGLIEELTVRENVEYPLRLAGAAHAAERVERILARLALGELAGRLPAETSVGQQQRVSLARALVLGPRIVLADEPTGHQDAASAELVVGELLRAADDGASVLVATHDPELAARCHRFIELGSPATALREAPTRA